MGSDFYLIGNILAPFGEDGSVKITSYSDFPERFFSMKFAFIDFFGQKKKINISNVKRYKNSIVIKFENFNNEVECRFLIGKDIFVDSENLFVLPENTYFIHDLIGSKVFQGEILLGNIKDVFSAPANDVYIIQDVNGEEILIPAVAEYIVSFDKENKVMKLKQGVDFIGEYED